MILTADHQRIAAKPPWSFQNETINLQQRSPRSKFLEGWMDSVSSIKTKKTVQGWQQIIQEEIDDLAAVDLILKEMTQDLAVAKQVFGEGEFLVPAALKRKVSHLDEAEWTVWWTGPNGSTIQGYVGDDAATFINGAGEKGQGLPEEMEASKLEKRIKWYEDYTQKSFLNLLDAQQALEQLKLR